MKLFILYSEALVVLMLLSAGLNLTDCYDPLDPAGNITVTFDLHHWTDDGYMSRVTIQNYFQYRHIGKPGWSLGWTWAGKEVIWSVTGAIAKKQGDCSEFKSRIPHCCRRDPVVVDLTPEAARENQTPNCCHGGLLSAWAINKANSFSTFEIVVGNLKDNESVIQPDNLTLVAPGQGYTCGPLLATAPTVVKVVGGVREEQAFSKISELELERGNHLVLTPLFWQIKHKLVASRCQHSTILRSRRVRHAAVAARKNGSNPLLANSAGDMVECTDHMCPIRVHWHIKTNYRDQWRVKMTVSNYNYHYNYSDWNLVVQHPSLRQQTQVYSFSSTRLSTVGDDMDEAAIFWGLKYCNEELLQAGAEEPGSVTTDILVDKDHESFTLRNGWAFPRRVYFNGDNCEMPMPDSFPRLPNTSPGPLDACNFLFHLFVLILFFHASNL